MSLPLGTVLVGTTRRHPGRIKIIGVKQRSYRVRFAGGQHNTGKEWTLSAVIVENFYRIIHQPRRNTREHELHQLPPLERPYAGRGD